MGLRGQMPRRSEPRIAGRKSSAYQRCRAHRAVDPIPSAEEPSGLAQARGRAARRLGGPNRAPPGLWIETGHQQV
jgi:hypothetical protein